MVESNTVGSDWNFRKTNQVYSISVCPNGLLDTKIWAKRMLSSVKYLISSWVTSSSNLKIEYMLIPLKKQKSVFSENKIKFIISNIACIWQYAGYMSFTICPIMFFARAVNSPEPKVRWWATRPIQWLTRGTDMFPKEKNTRREVKVSKIGFWYSLGLETSKECDDVSSPL